MGEAAATTQAVRHQVLLQSRLRPRGARHRCSLRLAHCGLPQATDAARRAPPSLAARRLAREESMSAEEGEGEKCVTKL